MARGYSLHVALNRIDPAHYGTEGLLRGCHADARDMAAIAAAAGLEPRGTLLDADATTGRVAGALRALAAEARPGDLVLATYSGHGSQVRDRQGEEPDGLDETWCLYDRMLLDDEVRALLAGFAVGVRVMVVSDSCHSATMARMVGPARFGTRARAAARLMAPERPEPPPGGVRLLDPFTSARAFEVNRARYAAAAAAVPPSPAPLPSPLPGPAIAALGACRDDQTALDGPDNGWMTYCLREAWASGPPSLWALAAATRGLAMPYQTPRLQVYGAGSRAFAARPPLEV